MTALVHFMASPARFGEDVLVEADEAVCDGRKRYPRRVTLVYHPTSIELGPYEWWCPVCGERTRITKRTFH